MVPDKIYSKISAALDSWEKMAHSPECEKLEWTRGVIYGITLCLRIVTYCMQDGVRK